jgi:plasmid stabilization system protein ParE
VIVRFRAEALTDLQDIRNYLHERSPSGALNVMRAIYSGTQVISESPQASERTDDPGMRVKVVTRYRYKSFYQILKGEIEIVHVRHMSRRPWP